MYLISWLFVYLLYIILCYYLCLRTLDRLSRFWEGNLVQIANDCCPYKFYEKGCYASLHTTGHKSPSFLYLFLSWVFISLAHSTRFWLLLASGVHRNSASLCIHHGKKFNTNVQVIWDGWSIHKWLVYSIFPSHFYNIHRIRCSISFVISHVHLRHLEQHLICT